MKIALAGNPNSGKTTFFNEITGKVEHVGNWGGVTVDKKEATLKDKYNTAKHPITIIDLPGAYSMSPYTSEEAVTRDFIQQENPDVIINIVDSTNLSRSLFFTTQLLDLGIPVVVALNKQDLTTKKKTTIDTTKLAKHLNCDVLQISALQGKSIDQVINLAIATGQSGKKQEPVALGIPQTASSKDEQALLDKKRFEAVDTIIAQIEKKTIDSKKFTQFDKLDTVVAHKYWGLPIFFVIMWFVYWFSQQGLGGYLSEYINETLFGEVIPDAVGGFLETLNVSPLLQALIVDGMIGGVGAVLGFLPLIMVLFFCLSLLEDCGYMARVAVVMDRYFKKIGLSGKSIIPMIVGSGCAIPGIMATRTIENEHERRMTSILTPFVPCGAKLPIIALFATVFFPKASWVGPSMYLVAIFIIIVAGLILKNIFKVESSQSMFIMEIPEYKLPSLKNAFLQMIDKAKHFIVKAGTIILVCNTAIWFMQTYNFSLQVVEHPDSSILAAVGGLVSPLLIPLGFFGWQLAASALTGFIAKENVVGSLAVMFATTDAVLHSSQSPMMAVFTPVTALAFMMFNLFTPPCFAAIGAMNSEMGGKKWLGIGLLFQLTTGYTVAMIVNQVGTLLTTGHVASGFVASLVILAVEIVAYITLTRKAKAKLQQMESIAA